MKSILIVAAALPAILIPSASAAEAPNVAGKWAIHNNISGNESDMVCTFTQTDTMLSGTCKSDGKDVPIAGTITDKKVTWKYNSEYEGSPITLTYTATIDGAGKFSGAVDVQPFAVDGDFTATPSKDPAK